MKTKWCLFLFKSILLKYSFWCKKKHCVWTYFPLGLEVGGLLENYVECFTYNLLENVSERVAGHSFNLPTLSLTTPRVQRNLLPRVNIVMRISVTHMKCVSTWKNPAKNLPVFLPYLRHQKGEKNNIFWLRYNCLVTFVQKLKPSIFKLQVLSNKAIEIHTCPHPHIHTNSHSFKLVMCKHINVPPLPLFCPPL